MLVAAGPSHTTFSQYGNSEEKRTSSSNTPSSISSAKYNLIRSVAAHINRGTEIIKETVQNHIISRLSTSSSVTACSTTAKTTSISSLNNPIKNEKSASDSLVLTSPRKDTVSANSFDGECCHFRTIEELPSHTIKRYNMLMILIFSTSNILIRHLHYRCPKPIKYIPAVIGKTTIKYKMDRPLPRYVYAL